MARNSLRPAGFTLVEVLIALAITAFVATIAYASLDAVLTGVEQARDTAGRTQEVNRAWMIVSRDLEQFVARPVRDEFGDVEPALAGGPAARFSLSLTRGGWHNPNALPRSNLERVNYRLEDGSLWRDSYPVLDRAGDSTPRSVLLLSGVEAMELAFLDSLSSLADAGGNAIDSRDWERSWVPDSGNPGAELAPPVALELRLQLEDLGEMRRLYALPSP